ncbi:hypothetical protein G1H11_15870 [Phytoactinopolyspora alkaliphila]|uniref:Uncharacterized protein n=1 Tax=Phytoactinopolyspora alkaliphila TaxID=1783498 RepID=A0A6N9YPB4_9ACTN|nr:heparinase II/III family protein [Phytoactinopolyspora alkaliphila]NED96787.1 hypothetical protein [Phytoactinopolyspora alkaliphila]
MTRWVESPPHIDETRMRHITDRHLVDSLDLTLPGLETVARAADDTDRALREWRAYRASGAAPSPVADIRRWVQRRRSRPSAPPADDALRSARVVRHVFGIRGGRVGFLEAAEVLLNEDVDFVDSSRGRSSFYGFHYLYWMRPLLEAYALTGDARYAARYGELFSQWYDARDQVIGDWPGLDVVWYSLGLRARSGMYNQAISLLSAEPAFTDEQWRRTMKSLLGGARWAAEEHVTFRNGNWQLVSVCELAHVASLYPEFAEHGTWNEVARRRIEDHLELDFYADGCHYERSPSYHTMCMEALHVAALSADPEQWPLADHPRLRAAHAWLADMAHPAGWLPHLQDSHLVRPAEMLLIGHHLYGVPEWKWLVERWMDPDHIVDRLDWLGPRPDGTDPVEFFLNAPSIEPSGRSELLRPSGYAMLRQGWAVDDLTAVVNAGPYIGHELEPHSHHAALDFVISGWGEALAWEAGGPPSYDDPGYYTWYQAGRGHNSVVLDGEPNSSERNTVVDSFWTLGGNSPRHQRHGVDVVAGRHDAFVRRHRRRMVFVRSDPAYWLVVDDFGDEPVESTWTIHGRSPWNDDGRRRFVSEAAPGLVVVPVDRPSGVEHGTGPARLPASQVALASDGEGDGERDLALRTRRSRPDEYGTIHGLHLSYECARLRTVLVPFGYQAPEVEAEATGGELLVVRIAGAVDEFGSGHWTRAYADGRVELARWDLDPEEPEPETRQGGETMPAIGGRGLCAWWCRTGDGVLTAELVTDRHATVTVDPPLGDPGGGQIVVNGVVVGEAAAGPSRITLPSAGTWSVQIEWQGTHG